MQDKETYPFYPIKGKEYRVEQELNIDLANEGVPDQATEVIVYATISMIQFSKEEISASLPSPWLYAVSGSVTEWQLLSQIRREVELIVSTKSSNGVIERKVFCPYGTEGVKSCNSANISLPVSCNGDRIVRIFFKGQSKSVDKAFVQIAGYYRK